MNPFVELVVVVLAIVAAIIIGWAVVDSARHERWEARCITAGGVPIGDRFKRGCVNPSALLVVP